MASSNEVFVSGSIINADITNGVQNETGNAITASGQALNTGDNDQTARAMTVHTAGADFYTDDGVADTYALTIAASGVAFEAITVDTDYFTGMRIRFVTTVVNTGASTINVSTLGAKSVFANGSALVGGELLAGREITLYYDGTNFNITNIESFSPSVFMMARLDVSGNLVGNSINVTSTGNPSTGTYTITFTNALSNINNFIGIATAGGSNGTVSISLPLGTGVITILIEDAAGAAIDKPFYIVAYDTFNLV